MQIILVDLDMSQLGQDVQILKRYQNGFFVDIGANNGKSLSNTYLLEKHGWKGICVEHNPAFYKQLCKNRKAICCNNALYTSYIEDSSISLNNLLEKHNAPSFIEYLSLDAEGNEYEILKTINFKKYTFGLIDVENNFLEPHRSIIQELLISNGYEFVKENKWGICYCKKQHYVATLLPGSALSSSILGVLFSLVYIKTNNIKNKFTINTYNGSSVAKYFFENKMNVSDINVPNNYYELFYSPKLNFFETKNNKMRLRYFEEEYELLQQTFDKYFSILQINEPNDFICLHIRRGDKLYYESELKVNSIDEYILKIEELKLQNKKILILTDQYDTYLEFVSKRPYWNVTTTSSKEDLGFNIVNINNESKIRVKKEVERMLEDFKYIKNANMFIGTVSSNVAYISILLRHNKNTILLD